MGKRTKEQRRGKKKNKNVSESSRKQTETEETSFLSARVCARASLCFRWFCLQLCTFSFSKIFTSHKNSTCRLFHARTRARARAPLSLSLSTSACAAQFFYAGRCTHSFLLLLLSSVTPRTHHVYSFENIGFFFGKWKQPIKDSATRACW